jgi:threonine dehydrogenase-like Zn-dependent dehydrogenase
VALPRHRAGQRAGPQGHEYAGIVEEIGGDVHTIKPGQFVVGSFCNRTIDPGKVFDLTLPLDQAAEGYRAMDERRAIKTLLQP